MIEIKRIRFKNVLSFGNAWTEFSFENGKQVLIVGENGNGKSAIYEVLYFGLYGKPFRKIKKDQLVNSTNGRDLLVEVEFSRGSSDYKIIRGIRPNVFEIWVDGKLRDQDASIKDYQGWFEANILKMDERTFRQIVILGSDFYTPFMNLSPGERRIVVADFLNVGIYATMLQKSKVELNYLTTKLQSLETRKSLLAVKLEAKIMELSRQSISSDAFLTNLSEKIKKAQEDLKAQDSELEKIRAKSAELERCIKNTDQLREMIRAGEKAEHNLNYKIRDHESSKNFFVENDLCDRCHQKISEHTRDHWIKENENRITTLQDQLSVVRVKLDEINAKLRVAEESKVEKRNLWFRETELTAEAAARKAQVEDLLDQVRLVKSGSTSAGSEVQSEIEDIRLEIQTVEAEIDSVRIHATEYERIVDLLKDDGIKMKIIRDYLPIINKLIKKYLDVLDFSVSFRFDENFDETILSRFRDDFSYGNFSAGERLRLDLTLLFTWREITRLKASSYCNLLVLDEIGDSSLDAAGLEAFMKIMGAEKQQQCAVIISHKPDGIASKVDHVVKIGKKNGFSFVESIVSNDEENVLL